jgi:hypothetical protein
MRKVYGIQRESPVASKNPRATSRGANDKKVQPTLMRKTKQGDGELGSEIETR